MTGQERAIHLLEEAAVALDGGRSPLDRSFLIEHDVTADECFNLAEMLGAGATLLAMWLRSGAEGEAFVFPEEDLARWLS